jgi:hypothetical protein
MESREDLMFVSFLDFNIFSFLVQNDLKTVDTRNEQKNNMIELAWLVPRPDIAL